MPAPVKFSFLELEPILEVLDVEKTLEYYTSTLGFDINFTYKNNDESTVFTHAGVSFGNLEEINEIHENNIHIHFQLTLSKEPINKSELFFRIGKEIYELFEIYKKKDVKIVSNI